MLSINKIESLEYYLALAVEDYYLSGGEPEGLWTGTGARRLGLGTKVLPKQLRKLMQGFGSDGQALVRNAGHFRRQKGWDLTFSAPKSVSVAWATAPKQVRRSIQNAHFRAVKAALHYLELNVVESRLGKGGIERVPADLVVATFEHGTSRALDPQLHTHALVVNLCVRPDGTTGTILSDGLYSNKLLAGALYRLQLAAELRNELGFNLVQKKTWFEIDGIDKPILDFFSTRRKQIEHELARRGLATAEAAAFAALTTREVKDVVPPRHELFEKWQGQCRELGFTRHQLEQLIRDPVHEQDFPVMVADAISKAIDQLEETESHFTQNDLMRATACQLQCVGMDLDDFLRQFDLQKEMSPRLINLGVRNEQRHYTTENIIVAEYRVLQAMQQLSERPCESIHEDSLETLLGNSFPHPANPEVQISLREEQAEAVRHLASANSSIRVVTGTAGTGKTAMLLATRHVFETNGYTVLGATPTHRARKELTQGSGINTKTLHKRLLQFRTADMMSSAEYYSLPSNQRKKLAAPLYLDDKSVVVVDEASMVDTTLFAQLLPHIEKTGARLLLVGDEKQLPSVGPGGVFDEIVNGLEHGHLANVKRQNQEWAREMVLELSEGRAERFLREYAAQGFMKVSQNTIAIEEDLLEDWLRYGGSEEPHSHVITAITNAQVDRYNELAQQARLINGQLDEASCVRVGDEPFYVGDRITFQRNAPKLSVYNGDIGTVVDIHNSVKEKINHG